MEGIFNNLKDKFTEVKNKFTLTEIEQKLEEATSNEHCHANVSLLDDIADRAVNYGDYQIIVNHIEKTLQVDKTKWRRILKTLFLVEHMLRVGNNRFVSSLNGFLYLVKSLTTFKYKDDKGEEKGGSIREKASFIVELSEDSDKLEEERKNYKGWKNRIAGVSSSGGGATSVSSSNYGSSSYGGVSSSYYSKKPEKQSNKVNTNYDPNNYKKTEIKKSNIESDSDEEKEKKAKSKKTKPVDEEEEDNDEDEGKYKEKEDKKKKTNTEVKETKEVKDSDKPKVNIKKFNNKQQDDDLFEEVADNSVNTSKKINSNGFDFFGSEPVKAQPQTSKQPDFDFFSAATVNTNTASSKVQVQEFDFSASTKTETQIKPPNTQSPFDVFSQYPSTGYYGQPQQPMGYGNGYGQGSGSNINYNTNIYNNFNNFPNPNYNPYNQYQYKQPPVQPKEKIALNYGSFKSKEAEEFSEVPEQNNQSKGKMGNLLDGKLVNLNDLGMKKK